MKQVRTLLKAGRHLQLPAKIELFIGIPIHPVDFGAPLNYGRFALRTDRNTH